MVRCWCTSCEIERLASACSHFSSITCSRLAFLWPSPRKFCQIEERSRIVEEGWHHVTHGSTSNSGSCISRKGFIGFWMLQCLVKIIQIVFWAYKLTWRNSGKYHMSKSWFGGTLSGAPGVLKSLSSSKFSHYHSGQPIHSLLSLHRYGNFIVVIDVN